jgi:autotransporter strand-loop-strand O-heptosyltransferase
LNAGVAMDIGTLDPQPAQPDAASSPGAPAVARAEPPAADLPTQEGPKGLRYDFNDGCRVAMPQSDHPWRVRLSDLDTGNILFETELKSGRINSTKRYFVRFRIEVWQNGESLFVHDYSAAGRDVLIQFPVETLGDPIGWFPYAVKFKQHHGCRLTCAMSDKIIPLFRDAYPDIDFITYAEAYRERFYATYVIAVYFVKGAIYDHKDCVPLDFRLVGLHRAAGYILGVDPTEAAPRISIADDTRPIAEPYVCIAVQSTLQAKFWNNPTGWREVVAFLKGAGYRVLCTQAVARTGADLDPYPGRGGRHDRRPSAGRTRAPYQARGFFHRPVERPVLARLGGRHAGGHDQRADPPDQRILHALPGDQLQRLQQLLERPDRRLRAP